MNLLLKENKDFSRTFLKKLKLRKPKDPWSKVAGNKDRVGTLWRGGGGKTQQMDHPPAHSEDKFGIGGTF